MYRVGKLVFTQITTDIFISYESVFFPQIMPKVWFMNLTKKNLCLKSHFHHRMAHSLRWHCARAQRHSPRLAKCNEGIFEHGWVEFREEDKEELYSMTSISIVSWEQDHRRINIHSSAGWCHCHILITLMPPSEWEHEIQF